jgi:hypothetical protein
MWRTVAQLAVAFAPLLLTAIPPFIRVLRTGKFLRAFFTCWGLLVFWIAFFSVGIPLISHLIDPAADKWICNWVPDPPGIIGIIFFGWYPAGVIVLIAFLTKRAIHWISTRKKPAENIPTNSATGSEVPEEDNRQ